MELLGEVRRHVDPLLMTGGGKKAKKNEHWRGKENIQTCQSTKKKSKGGDKEDTVCRCVAADPQIKTGVFVTVWHSTRHIHKI